MRPIRAAMRIGPGREGRELLWVDLGGRAAFADGGFARSAGLLVIKSCNSASAKAALMMCGYGARRDRQGPGAAVGRPRYRGPAFE